MRKPMAIILAVLLLGIFVGCEQNKTVQIGEANTSSETIEETGLKDFEGTITNAMEFHEDLAFISTSDDKNLNICITKTGKQLFALSGENYALSGFKNGLAIASINDIRCLIDTSGKVVVCPETHGYTQSVSEYKAYYDGFFPVYKENKTYEGTTFEFGVIGPDGEWILEMSSKYMNIASKHSFGAYRNGQLNIDDKWINLKTGDITNNLITQIGMEEWIGSGGQYYNVAYNGSFSAADNIMLDISEKYKTVSLNSRSEFAVGSEYAVLTFMSEEFATIIDRKGNMMFEPIEIYHDNSNFALGTRSMKLLDNEIFWALTDGSLSIYQVNGEKLFSTNLVSSMDELNSIKVSTSSNSNLYLVCETSINGYKYTYTYYYLNSNGKKIIG